MRKFVYFLALGSTVLLSACNSKAKENKDAEIVEDTVLIAEEEIVGDDVDSHGCNMSAGYIWSQVNNDCIRIFEAGIRMKDMMDSAATSSAFIVFGKDSSQCEVFLPQVEASLVLPVKEDKGVKAWVNDDITVKQVKGQWEIVNGDKLLFAQDPSQPIKVTYKGSDNKTKRLYQVNVVFDPVQEVAMVTMDDQEWILPIQVSGSGFKYGNDSITLSGKGKEALLTTKDINLTLVGE